MSAAGDNRGPYWKRAHHDWKFWFGMVMMFLALAMYVMSNDLSRIPQL